MTRKQETLAGHLTRTLIVWIGSVWLICVLGVVWYVAHEIKHNFDSELTESAHRLLDITTRELEQWAHTHPPPSAPSVILPSPLYPKDAITFRVVDEKGHTLLRSSDATDEIFSPPVIPGFANSDGWRIYTVHHPVLNVYMQLADPLEDRRIAVNRTLVGLIIPLGAVLPLLALMLWRIARKELHPLQWLADQVAQRSGTDLRPIALPALPQELHSVGDDVNRLLERLAQALDVERALAANAAHELRTPLATARLRLQTALEHALQREDVQAALDALTQLGRRTEKLLQLSRAESGASLARNPVDLVVLAGTVAEEFWQQSQPARERLNLRLPSEGVAVALGDVDALAIALRNLVENALRYSEGQAVEIEVMQPATLAVRDQGPGLQPAQLQTLQQRHVRHSANHTGYGLGLSIVNTIVTKHGARLEMHSPPPGRPHGLEARIVLPPAP